jgi:hypothetical protein
VEGRKEKGARERFHARLDYPTPRFPDYPTICAIVSGCVRIVIRIFAFAM